LTTPFQPVSFNAGDNALLSKFNQMANNSQWLFENLPKIRYKTSAITRDTNTKILALRTPYGATTGRQVRFDVYFDGFFSSGCQPIGVGTAISNGQKRLQVVIAGLGNSPVPDSRGAFIQLEADEIYPVGTDQLGGMIYTAGFVDCIFVGY
jgi:hypothetical protein